MMLLVDYSYVTKNRPSLCYYKYIILLLPSIDYLYVTINRVVHMLLLIDDTYVTIIGPSLCYK